MFDGCGAERSRKLLKAEGDSRPTMLTPFLTYFQMEVEDFNLSESILEIVHARTSLDRQLYDAMQSRFNHLAYVRH